MANTLAGAYGLSVFSPIINGHLGELSMGSESYASVTRTRLMNLQQGESSPMSKVPNTYMCRFYVLNDVVYQGFPANEEHLKSKYLVFSTNFHGDNDADRDTYLRGMWNAISDDVKHIWEYAVAFNQVTDADSFVEYIKKCQVETSLFFNGSTGKPLQEQLKALYLKQEFTRFVTEHQGLDAEALHTAYKVFSKKVNMHDVAGPSWSAGWEG